MANRMLPSKLRWTIVAAFLVLLATLAALVPQDAEAIQGVCAYYSDATFTTVVGARGTGCCGSVINWGITTPYRRCEQIYCPDVVCPIYE